MRVAAFVLSCTLAAGAACADVTPAAGLCASAEKNFFTCRTSQNKWISLCGQPPGTLQYRFGTTSRAELAFPAEASGGASAFLYAHYFRYQTDRTEVSFNNRGVDYAIFDYSEAGKRHAGVRVTSGNAREMEIACSGPISSRLQELSPILRCDADNALNSGACR